MASRKDATYALLGGAFASDGDEGMGPVGASAHAASATSAALYARRTALDETRLLTADIWISRLNGDRTGEATRVSHLTVGLRQKLGLVSGSAGRAHRMALAEEGLLTR